MKKMTLIAMVLVLTMLLGCTALAETASEASAGSAANTQTEEVITEGEKGKDSFLDWINQGMDIVYDTFSDGWNKAVDAAETGWNKASEAVTSGIDWLDGKISDWTDKAEVYMQKKQWDKKVQDAWEILKNGALQAGESAEETLTEAYHTVREWLMEVDDTMDQEVAEAVDRVAEAAGVAEAKLSGWYRKMEGYMTEKANLVTESVREAWAQIRQNTVKAGSVAEEKLTEAYTTIHEWLLKNGEPEDSEIVQGLKIIEEKGLQN